MGAGSSSKGGVAIGTRTITGRPLVLCQRPAAAGQETACVGCPRKQPWTAAACLMFRPHRVPSAPKGGTVVTIVVTSGFMRAVGTVTDAPGYGRGRRKVTRGAWRALGQVRVALKQRPRRPSILLIEDVCGPVMAAACI